MCSLQPVGGNPASPQAAQPPPGRAMPPPERGPDQETLMRLERLASIGTLSAMMAHEIRNALVTSKTFVELLLEKDPHSELGELVRRELGRIDEISSRVLRYANPRDVNQADFSLHGSLDYLLKLLQPRLRAQAIEVKTAFNANPDVLKGSEANLQQAFLNLLLNALEAMGQGGTLSLSTENTAAGEPPDAAHLRLVIEDTGPGINGETAQRLFEPFFTTKPEGTGLGLAITNRIIREHNGLIALENPARRGARFAIVLPVS